jgi:hypothetical protein
LARSHHIWKIAATTVLCLLPHVQLHAADKQSGSVVDTGIRMDWSYEVPPGAAEDGYGLLNLRISDDLSRQPLRYSPSALLAWMQRDRGALSDAELNCSDKVKSLASNGMGYKADIDLNEYRVVTLNADGTIAFINPFVKLGNAKLESIIDLGAKPRNWLMTEDTMTAWVLTENPSKLSRIDLYSRKITDELPLPPRTAVEHIFYDDVNRALILPMPGIGTVGIVDLASGKPKARLLNLKNAQSVFQVENNGASKSILISLGNGEAVWFDGKIMSPKFFLPSGVVAAVHSKIAAQTIVGTGNGQLYAQSVTGNLEKLISLPHPISAMKSLDEGRIILAIGGDKATIIDVPIRKIIQSIEVTPKATNILLTERFVYATAPATGRATLLALADLKTGRVSPLHVDIAAPEPGFLDASGPSLIQPSPSGEGLLTASPSSGMVFEYSEGMMAPASSLSNFRRAAVGLLVVNYAPRAMEAGHYRSVVRPRKTGRYKLIVGGAAPRFSACVDVTLTAPHNNGETTDTAIKAELLSAPGAEGLVRIRVLERTSEGKKKTINGLLDLRLLVFDRRTGWQRYVILTESKSGEYEAHVRVPRDGKYELLASSNSAKLSFIEGMLGATQMSVTP